MTASNNTFLGTGTIGVPQQGIEEQVYPQHEEKAENNIKSKALVYSPSPKHDPSHNWGTVNPIKSKEEGQRLLETGYKDGKQIYNVMDDGTIVKFQPDNSPDNGYHSYKVSNPRDIPTSILKQMLSDGKINKVLYNKLRKGKR